MAPEIKHLTDENFSDFVKRSYSVQPEEVETIIENARARSTKYVGASSLIMSDVGFTAEREGIDKVPVMLAAIVKLGGRELSKETYARILARAEKRTSQIMLDKRNYKEALSHAQKAVTLLEFLADL